MLLGEIQKVNLNLFVFFRFYSGDSSFVHGGLDRDDETLEPVSLFSQISVTNYQNILQN